MVMAITTRHTLRNARWYGLEGDGYTMRVRVWEIVAGEQVATAGGELTWDKGALQAQWEHYGAAKQAYPDGITMALPEFGSSPYRAIRSSLRPLHLRIELLDVGANTCADSYEREVTSDYLRLYFSAQP